MKQALLTSLIAFRRSSHSFHSYDLMMFVSSRWVSVCVQLSHLTMGLTSKLTPDCICEVTKEVGVTWPWALGLGQFIMHRNLFQAGGNDQKPAKIAKLQLSSVCTRCVIFTFKPSKGKWEIEKHRPQYMEWQWRTAGGAAAAGWAQGSAWLSPPRTQSSHLPWRQSSRQLVWSWRRRISPCVSALPCSHYLQEMKDVKTSGWHQLWFIFYYLISMSCSDQYQYASSSVFHPHVIVVKDERKLHYMAEIVQQ